MKWARRIKGVTLGSGPSLGPTGGPVNDNIIRRRRFPPVPGDAASRRETALPAARRPTRFTGIPANYRPDIQERMVGHLTRCDEDYGRRVAEGLGRTVGELAADGAASR